MLGHPLHDADIRIERVGKHLYEIAAEIEAYREQEQDRVVIYHDSILNQANFTLSESAFLPDALFLAVSDCIHNLRSALDYVVFELAYLDSGKIQNQTQFPICDKPERFWKEAPRRLKGLSDKHQEMIAQYQPFKAAEWTRVLRDLSNPDKHRYLPRVEGGQIYSFSASVVPPSLEGKKGKVIAGVGKDRGNAYVETDFRLKVLFDDDLPVVETLETLKHEVQDFINVFRAEFPSDGCVP